MLRRKLLLLSAVVATQFCFTNGSLAQVRSNDDYCLDTGRTRLFLVDITTEYDDTDKTAIIEMIDKVLATAKGGDRIVIRTITDSFTTSERLIRRCVPQCPARGMIDRLFKCSDGLLRTDTDVVRREILDALRGRLANFKQLKYSDILRTINSDVQEETRKEQRLDLFIYSDLIENSEKLIPEANFFRYPIPMLLTNLKRFDLIAPLPNSEVQVAGVGRADSPGRPPLAVSALAFLKEFWNSYFRAGGAATVSISERASAK